MSSVFFGEFSGGLGFWGVVGYDGEFYDFIKLFIVEVKSRFGNS